MGHLLRAYTEIYNITVTVWPSVAFKCTILHSILVLVIDVN